MKLVHKLIAVAFALLCIAPAQAHEFWIEPDSFRPQTGSVVRVALHVGERFAGEPYTYDPDRIDKFFLVGPQGESPIMGKSGGATGFAKIESDGLHVIGYRSKRANNELPAAKFEEYLREEGLAHIIPLRAQRGQSDKPGREAYSRCAKSLICAGGDCSTGHDRSLGYPLELFPVQNPYMLKPGDELTVRVLYDGQPLLGAKLVAVHKRDPHKLSAVVSDAQGQAAFKLTAPGAWLITTIHMAPAPAGLDADWESFWASLTFELPL